MVNIAPVTRTIATVVTLLLLCHQHQQQVQCANNSNSKCNESELEDNITKLVGPLSDTRYPIPRTEREFTKFCANNKDGAKFIKDYSNRCLKGTAKTVLSVFAYSNTRSNKRYCTKRSTKARDEMVSYANCINPNKKLVINCYRTYLNKMNLTHSIENPKQRIPHMCCLSAQLKTCVVSELEKSNHPACTADVIQSYGDYFDSTSTNILNTICDGADENSDRCDKVYKLPKAKLTKVNYKSPFPIVIAILDSL